MSDSQAFIKQLAMALTKVSHFLDFEIYLDERHTIGYFCRKNIQIKRPADIVKSDRRHFSLQINLFLRQNRSGSLSIQLEEPPNDISFLVETVLQQCRVKSSKVSQLQPFELPVMGLQILDPRFANLADSDFEDILHWNFDVIRAHSSRLKSGAFRLESSEVNRYHYRYNRKISHEPSTFFRIVGEIETLNINQPSITAELSSRHFADVASRPLGISLIKKMAPQDVVVPSSYEMVVFSPQVTASIITAMLPAFDIRLIQGGNSFLSDQQGKTIAGKWVHIIDDASISNGLQTRSFDARGVPPSALTLIREGVVDCLYIDPKTARDNNITPSGHTGFANELLVGNICIKTGRRSLNMILSEGKQGVMATQLSEPVQLDLKSGDIVLKAFFVDLASEMKPIGIKTVRTNLLTLLPKVFEAANDQKRIGYVDASSWFLREIAVED